MWKSKRKRRDEAINEARSLDVQRKVGMWTEGQAIETFKARFPNGKPYIHDPLVGDELFAVVHTLKEVIARLERTDNPEEG